MIENRIVVRVADNGFVLEYDDPKIVERNRNDEGEFQDPEVSKVYPDSDSLMRGVQAAVSVVTGQDQQDSSAEFEQAFAEASNV